MVYSMIVDAKDAAAVRFYQHFGFTRLGDDQRRLFQALKSFSDEAQSSSVVSINVIMP
jgi:hypothetical protein